MDILWNRDIYQTIQEVQHTLQNEKATNFNTVMTVMNRLVDKGILEKRKEGRSSLFKPVQTRNEFLNTQLKKMTSVLMEEFGHVIVSHVIDALQEADDTQLAMMEQKISELKSKNKG